MGAIRPGSGGGGGASALGDLSDIGVMGEDIGQADDLTEVVTAMGGAAAVRTAIDVAQDGPTVTYTLGGTVTDYTADSAYAPSGLSAVTGGSVSGRLGAGIAGDVPYFTALYKSRVSVLARNANGLRLTIAAANSAGSPYPYADDGGALLIPLPVTGRDVQIDVRIATNIEAVGRAAGGTDTLSVQCLVVRDADTARPYVLAGINLNSYFPVLSGAIYEYYYVLASEGSFGTSPGTQLDVSSAGEGTSAGVTARDVRITIKGHTLKVETGPAGGSLTERAHYADVKALAWRGDLSLVLAFGQNQSTPAAYYAELRALTITPL